MTFEAILGLPARATNYRLCADYDLPPDRPLERLAGVRTVLRSGGVVSGPTALGSELIQDCCAHR
eukprot:10212894-Alexandrium_andersonii.AAC.1